MWIKVLNNRLPELRLTDYCEVKKAFPALKKLAIIIPILFLLLRILEDANSMFILLRKAPFDTAVYNYNVVCFVDLLDIP